MPSSYKWFALAAIQGDQDAAKKSDEVAARLDQQSLAAARLAVKTWSVQSQPDDAINVKTPPSGWDATASAAPAAKPKQQPQAAKTPAPSAKLNESINPPGTAPRRWRRGAARPAYAR